MSNSIKLGCVLALCFLQACTPKEEVIIPVNQKVVFEEPIGDPVTSPISIPYVWNNPITISTYTQEETEKVYTSYLKITGLKDHSVENKINQTIKDKFDVFTHYADLKNVPTFRGIRQKVKDGAIVQSINVYVNSAFNANNVLSVCFTLYLSILNIDQSQVNINLSDGMTFELIHGETLNLSDVFTDEADISTLINDSLSMTLGKLGEGRMSNYYYGTLSQVKPFTGIHADQAFFVSEAGLHVLFDYRTPDFETNLSTSMLTIPYYDFLDFIGLTQRFSATTDLYENPIIDRQFLLLGDDQSELILEKLTFGDRVYYIRMSYPGNLDQTLIDVLFENKAKVKEELALFASTHTIDYLSGSISANQIGSYTCLYASYDAYAQADMTYSNEFQCYDKNNSLVEIQDYFKPGYDYESAIRTALVNEINTGYLSKDISVDELYQNMKIRIESTHFYISSWATSPSEKVIQNLGMTPLFSVFGIENLTIFD